MIGPMDQLLHGNQLTSNIDSVFLGAGFPADTSPVDSQEAAMVGAKGAQAAADPEASSGRPIHKTWRHCRPFLVLCFSFLSFLFFPHVFAC